MPINVFPHQPTRGQQVLLCCEGLDTHREPRASQCKLHSFLLSSPQHRAQCTGRAELTCPPLGSALNWADSSITGPRKTRRELSTLTSDEHLINRCFLWLFMSYNMHTDEHVLLVGINIKCYLCKACISFYKQLTRVKK